MSRAEGDTGRQRYRMAGAVYLALAGVIVALTVASPELASPERRADVIHLLFGLPFIALFGLLIAYGDRIFAALVRWQVGAERAAAVGCWLQEKLTMLLTLSALGRTFFYLANGLGHQPRLRPEIALVAVDPNPKMLINAVLMAVIVIFLVRAVLSPGRRTAGSARTGS